MLTTRVVWLNYYKIFDIDQGSFFIKNDRRSNADREVVGTTGIEPVTSGATIRHSGQLSYVPTAWLIKH